MAGGWSRGGVLQDQIGASVGDEVQRARIQLAPELYSGASVVLLFSVARFLV